jgi:CheY-like chemotaxis protein
MTPLALIAEDSAEQAYIFRKSLFMSGYQVEVVNNGLDASARLQEIVPRIVVLDLHLPGMSGEKLVHQIRSDERLKDTKIFLITGDDGLAEKLRDVATITLLKPISFAQLSMLATKFLPQTGSFDESSGSVSSAGNK